MLQSKLLVLLVAALLAACSGGKTEDPGEGAGEIGPATPEGPGTKPFTGPCDLSGTWLVTSEKDESPGCWMPAISRRLLIDPLASPPASFVGSSGVATPIESELSEDGCTLRATWGSYDESFGEPNGYDDALDLVMRGPTWADGSLHHSQYWWCGSMLGAKTYPARADKE